MKDRASFFILLIPFVFSISIVLSILFLRVILIAYLYGGKEGKYIWFFNHYNEMVIEIYVIISVLVVNIIVAPFFIYREYKLYKWRKNVIRLLNKK